MIRVDLIRGLIVAGLLLSGSRGPAQDDGPRSPRADRVRTVLESEELLENLRGPLLRLSRSVSNLQFPDQGSRSLFSPRVWITDLSASPGPLNEVLDLGVSRGSWTARATRRERSVEDLSLWATFLQRVRFFHHFGFTSIRGTFTDETRREFEVRTGFKGLAELHSGPLLAVQGEATVVWRRSPDGAGERWRIRQFRTENMQVTETSMPLFSDVLERVLGVADRARACHSGPMDHLCQLVVDLRAGKVLPETGPRSVNERALIISR